MPELAHFIISFSIIIPILYFTGDKFNYKVAAIFIINNWIGPDSAQAYKFLPVDFHYLLPFFIWAMPLALFYSFLSRFSIKRYKHFFKLVDDGKREVSWRNAYLLCVAAGLIHTISDTLFRNNLKIKFLEGVFEPTLFDVHRYGFILEIDLPILQMISYIIFIALTLLTVYIVDRDFKDILVFFITLSGMIILIIFLLGEDVVGGEYDAGATVFSLIFIFIPLMLLLYVAKDVNENPTVAPESPLIEANLGLKIVGIISLLLATLLLLLGILGVVAPSVLQVLLDFSEKSFFYLGIVFLLFSGIAFFGAIGLFFQINLCRYFTMFICLVMTIFVYPLVIMLYLSKDNVKVLFDRDVKD